jgi:hypothetical protein
MKLNIFLTHYPFFSYHVTDNIKMIEATGFAEK